MADVPIRDGTPRQICRPAQITLVPAGAPLRSLRPPGIGERDADHDQALRRVHLSPGMRGTRTLDGTLTPLGYATVDAALGRVEQELFEADWALSCLLPVEPQRHRRTHALLEGTGRRHVARRPQGPAAGAHQTAGAHVRVGDSAGGAAGAYRPAGIPRPRAPRPVPVGVADVVRPLARHQPAPGRPDSRRDLRDTAGCGRRAPRRVG
jgi:hypothetical protein